MKLAWRFILFTGICLLLSPSSNTGETRSGIPITGKFVPELVEFDREMARFVRDKKIPGAAVALTKNGRLVYARGFGYADRENRVPVKPDALFRIGSISKPITAVAVLRLVENGRLRLDAPVYSYLGLRPFYEGSGRLDPRWRRVTVRQLLHHSGGWDRKKTFDPMGRSRSIARRMRTDAPASPRHIARYMMGRPLDFEPGSRYKYSNFGYSLLGRVIEKASGQSYIDYTRRTIFRPLGMRGMRMARGGLENRAPGEVKYYNPEGRTARAWFGRYRGRRVPYAYSYAPEIYDSHGGWLAGAPDLARFLVALSPEASGKIISPSNRRRMLARPPAPLGLDRRGRPSRRYYGLGLSVLQFSRSKNYWHSGAMAYCCSAFMVYLEARRFGWIVLFNMRNDARGKGLPSQAEGPIYRAMKRVRRWPTHDLFSSFGGGSSRPVRPTVVNPKPSRIEPGPPKRVEPKRVEPKPPVAQGDCAKRARETQRRDAAICRRRYSRRRSLLQCYNRALTKRDRALKACR